MQAAHRWLTEQRQLENDDEEAAERERDMRRRMETESVERVEAHQTRLRVKRGEVVEEFDDDDDDDHDVEVEYVR